MKKTMQLMLSVASVLVLGANAQTVPTYTNSDIEKITPTTPIKAEPLSEEQKEKAAAPVEKPVDDDNEDFYRAQPIVEFTGKASFSKKDRDKDGLIETLQVRVPIRITENVPVSAIGVLKKNGEIIASRPNWHSAQISQAQLSGDRIKQTIRLDFSGEEIYRAKQNGPFDLEVHVTAGGNAITKTFASRAYDFKNFGEVGLHIVGLSEQPRFITEYTTKQQYVDNIDVVIQIDARRAGMFFLYGELEKAESRLQLGELQLSEAGYHSVRLPVPLHALREARLDGPYDVYIRIVEKRTNQVAEDHFTTHPYQHQYFRGQ